MFWYVWPKKENQLHQPCWQRSPRDRYGGFSFICWTVWMFLAHHYICLTCLVRPRSLKTYAGRAKVLFNCWCSLRPELWKLQFFRRRRNSVVDSNKYVQTVLRRRVFKLIPVCSDASDESDSLKTAGAMATSQRRTVEGKWWVLIPTLVWFTVYLVQDWLWFFVESCLQAHAKESRRTVSTSSLDHSAPSLYSINSRSYNTVHAYTPANAIQ